jgi:hypothetical protein
MEWILVRRNGGTPMQVKIVFLSCCSDHLAGKDIYVTLTKVLHAKGLVDSPKPESPAARLGFKTDYEAVSAELARVS